jgi:hypothetical protein
MAVAAREHDRTAGDRNRDDDDPDEDSLIHAPAIVMPAGFALAVTRPPAA